ncbi:hypothetical protein SEA_MOSSY_40 [Gordonia phage Mossy]|nr:hypothetical protein SEA_MOSSY_40 [Gordonia phage Mossy]
MNNEIKNKIATTKKFVQKHKVAIAFAAGSTTACSMIYLIQKNRLTLEVPRNAVDQLRDGGVFVFDLPEGALTLDFRESFQNRT